MANSEIQNSTAEQKPHDSKSRKHVLIWAMVCILGISVIAGIIFYVHGRNKPISRSNTAFIINGKAYSKEQLSAMVDFALTNNSKSVQRRKNSALDIYDMYRTQVAAKKLGIVANSSDLEKAKNQITIKNANTKYDKEYLSLVVGNEALSNAYQRYSSQAFEGYSFVLNYSLKILATTPGKPATPGKGDKALIEKDRTYAKQKAEQFYRQYKQKQITAQQLTAKINADTRINYTPYSTQFGTNSDARDLSSQVYYTGVYDYIISQKNPGLSPIRSGKVATKLNPGEEDYEPGYYYFVDLQKASRYIANPASSIEKTKSRQSAVYYGL